MSARRLPPGARPEDRSRRTGDSLPQASTQQPQPALALRALTRHFRIGLLRRRREALRGVDLELPLGARLGLVGPNGSGKTSLLRILAGVDEPSGGEARVLGGDPLERKTRARLAFLPEDSPFPPELDARSALALVGALHGVPRGRLRERSARLLERVGLAREAKLALGRYSRGMLRRFGLAQAFLTDPDLVLLDEPTAGLDAQGFEALEALLADARERGTTLVLASHLGGDVHATCDHVAVLLAGKLALFGSAEHLLAAAGRVSLEVEGLDPDALHELERWIGSQGGRLVSRGPAWLALRELYRAAGSRRPAGDLPR